MFTTSLAKAASEALEWPQTEEAKLIMLNGLVRCNFLHFSGDMTSNTQKGRLTEGASAAEMLSPREAHIDPEWKELGPSIETISGGISNIP